MNFRQGFNLRVAQFWILSILLLSSCSTIKIPGDDPMGQLTADLSFLASDYMEGRETGTEGEKKAAEYIVKRYKEIGLKPLGDQGTYMQNYTRKIKMNPHAEVPSANDPTISGNNLVGFVDNGSDQIVVLGAHYDHLGYGGEGSLYTGPEEIHNGADDNASGVSALLYLAEMLHDNPKAKKYDYLFLAFSGEEKGLWGSNYYVNHPTVDMKEVVYMINMDMVGRLNDKRVLAVGGTGTSPIWNKYLDKLNKGFKLKKSESGIGPSDHTSFYLKDKPVLFFFTGQHKDYHKPTDDIEHINFLGLRDISQYIYRIVIKSQKSDSIPFTKTKEEKNDTPNFNVTLGVMPDYLYDGKGMRIDGVREGKTADKHGILQGDIVLKMGDIDVYDMKSYMKALGVYKPGDTIDVVVKREDKTITKKVTF